MSRTPVLSCLFILVGVVGCASTKVEDRQIIVTEKIPRPDHIWVYDLATTPGEIPADSSLDRQQLEQAAPQTADQIAAGRQVGAAVAGYLVDEIRAMGLPAERASGQTAPQLNDLVLRGYLLSINKGSAVERVAIGFGDGAAELKVALEGFQVTEHGLRKLGSGTVGSGGGKSPGAIAPAAIALATANPIGLIVSSGVKVYGEASGSSTIEGREKAVAKEVAEKIRPRFEDQGWIE